MDDVLKLVITMLPLVAVLGVAAFISDHWDNSGQPLIVWFVAGFPSPWRFARRKCIHHQYRRLSNERRQIAKAERVDPNALVQRNLL